MDKQENATAKGRVKIEVFRVPLLWRKLMQFVQAIGLFDLGDKIMRTYGVPKFETRTNNTLMNAFWGVIAGLSGATGAQTAFGYIALGTSNTAVVATQTALQAETVASGLTRAVATVDRITTSQTNDTVRLRKTFTAGASATIEEVGIFNDPTVGVMGGRALTGSKPLVSTDTIAITYTVQFS